MKHLFPTGAAGYVGRDGSAPCLARGYAAHAVRFCKYSADMGKAVNWQHWEFKQGTSK